MPDLPRFAATEEEIEAFKRSLNEEYDRKISDLEKGLKRELEELIASSRLAVEKRVVAIQQDLNRRYDENLKLVARRTQKLGRERLLAFSEELLRSAEKRITEALMAVRQDEERYERAMRALLDEALREIDGTAVAIVGRGDGRFLSQCDRVSAVHEEDIPLGGCTVTDAEGERIVDNTFEGRRKKVKKSIIRRISAALWPLMEEIGRSG
ncbi:MAG TPA: V-type ATP synthase subunit E family protein [Thermosynergistes sp.]|nr:V-type ATP synthase subunit E family protein [Thermosynergistes sp.]